MAQNCTILCPRDEPARVVTLVRELMDERGQITVESAVEDWASITIEDGETSLVLNRLVFRASGDQFARMQVGMSQFFEGVETEHAAIKAGLIERIDNFALAIGVIAEPSFVEDAGHFECIFGLAGALDAVIWNGSGIIDAEGNMILDSDGESEVAE